MPPKRRFDKKSAKTYSVVHRAHDDALYYDDEAPEHVLIEAPTRHNQRMSTNKPKKVFNTEELEKQLTPSEAKKVRENEGLAAQYGIYFDDTKYDYMQHLKPIGNADGVFISAKDDDKKLQKGKNTGLESLIRESFPSEQKRKIAHDASESIPEELRGFNPHMDSRLREVLEALEDEEYITDNEKEDEDVFADLLKSGEAEEEDAFYSDEYDEWDLDNYDYDEQYDSDRLEQLENPYNEGEGPDEGVAVPGAVVSSNWEKDFQNFKVKSKNTQNDWDSDDDFDDEQDELPELPNIDTSNKKSKTKLRKKKGAMTDTSSFSMSSSAVFRTEGLNLLDDRYEQLSKKFNQDDEGIQEAHKPFKLEEERNDLEGMLDDFLDNYELEGGGRKLVKKDSEREKIQSAADSVSKGKLAARRKKEKASMSGLGGSFGNLNI